MSNNLGALTLLSAAKSLVESGWTQGELARDAGGFACSTTAPDAESYCMIGALTAADCAYSDDDNCLDYFAARGAVEAVVAEGGFFSIAQFNDDPATEQAHVVAAFDDAIMRVRWGRLYPLARFFRNLVTK